MPMSALTVRVSVVTVVMPEQRVRRTSKDSGDPLRGRAFRSNRPAGDFHCNPCRLRSASPRCARPLARRLAALADGCPADTACRPSGHGVRHPPRSPWPAMPATGIASARRSTIPCVAGVGFAVPRPPHCAVHEPAHQCPRSCARSCGAPPHFAPHRAGQSCPHDCGHLRRRLRQRAAHDCPRLRPPARRSRAAEAPLRRVHRRRFPVTPCSTNWPLTGRGRLRFLTPHAPMVH